ncbi:MAG: oxidoreductase, partial [Pseudomonadota bacterium]
EDPETLPTPDQVAELLLPLCLPSFSETGKLFDGPSRTVKDPSAD